MGLKKFFKVLVEIWKKNVPLLISESLFDITITYSDIPYKCSLAIENENLKIFDFNYFSKS